MIVNLNDKLKHNPLGPLGHELKIYLLEFFVIVFYLIEFFS